MLIHEYPRKDDAKRIIESTTVTTVTTTYIGKAKWDAYNAVQNTDTAIWSIEKLVEDTSTGVSEVFRPDGSTEFGFIRDNRAALTYV